MATYKANLKDAVISGEVAIIPKDGVVVRTNNGPKQSKFITLLIEGTPHACYFGGTAKGATTLAELANQPIIKYVDTKEGTVSYGIGESSTALSIAEAAALFA